MTYPGTKFTPPTVDGARHVRTKCFTGEACRMSSTAALSRSDGSDQRSSSWSRYSSKACRPPAIEFDVVSCPAVAMIR